jgi:hypothetical protein
MRGGEESRSLNIFICVHLCQSVSYSQRSNKNEDSQYNRRNA